MSIETSELIAQLIGATNRLTRAAAQQTSEPRNSTSYRILGALRQFGPSRVGEIAAHERISQPGATKAVTALELDGLVARESDPDDLRASRISITDAGNAAVDAWLEQLASVVVPKFGTLSDTDRAAIARTIRLLEASITD
jgi:DNA-binding MarR family transcriptional regulator